MIKFNVVNSLGWLGGRKNLTFSAPCGQVRAKSICMIWGICRSYFGIAWDDFWDEIIFSSRLFFLPLYLFICYLPPFLLMLPPFFPINKSSSAYFWIIYLPANYSSSPAKPFFSLPNNLHYLENTCSLSLVVLWPASTLINQDLPQLFAYLPLNELNYRFSTGLL